MRLQIATTPWVGMAINSLFNSHEDAVRKYLKLDPKAKTDEDKDEFDLKGLE